MKKLYTFLFLFSTFAMIAIGQNRSNKGFPSHDIKHLSDDTETSVINSNSKLKNQISKAIGDTLYYEDFANQIPAGWTVVNNAGNSNNWIWSNSAPGGQYSGNTAVINSTTSSNGFLSLPSDLYNTPFPVGGPVAMDVYIQSPSIPITPKPSVVIRFQQSQRYCCNANTVVQDVEVSADGINWTAFDAKFGRGPNTASPSPTNSPAEQAVFNVSSVLANQSTAYIRFNSRFNDTYYWMIDDLALVEGAGNAIELEDWSINFSDTSINPVLMNIPQLVLNPLTFDGALYNAGSNTLNGVNLEVEIVQDSTYFGMPGTGTRDILTTNLGIPMPSLQRDTLRASTYVNTGDGYFRAIFRAKSSAVNQNPSAAIGQQRFIVTDSILSKDLGPYVGVAGPGNFVGGGNDGDMWGSLMSVGTNAKTSSGITANSISVLVGNNQNNVGSAISPRVWFWNDTATTIANAISTPAVGSSPFSTTIDTSMLGRWITIPLFPPANIVPGSQYVVGWEQITGAASGAEFTAARDRNSEPLQPIVSNFVFVNDASPGWGWVSQVAAIRLNLDLTIGVDEKETSTAFSVFPNPNDGNFNLNLNSNTPKTYNLIVRNTLGQVVYEDNLSVNGQKRQEIGLAGMDKGMYFISLTNGSERLVKKLIVK